MPGYQLIEQRALQPFKANGIAPFPEEMGILDFLRELAADEFPFPKFTRLRLVGLEQVLYSAHPDERNIALEIRHRLQSAAQDLQTRLLQIQVIFQGELKRGDTLWLEYRGQRLPIDYIFGSPLPQTDSLGNRHLNASFNLTS